MTLSADDHQAAETEQDTSGPIAPQQSSNDELSPGSTPDSIDVGRREVPLSSEQESPGFQVPEGLFPEASAGSAQQPAGEQQAERNNPKQSLESGPAQLPEGLRLFPPANDASQSSEEAVEDSPAESGIEIESSRQNQSFTDNDRQAFKLFDPSTSGVSNQPHPETNEGSEVETSPEPTSGHDFEFEPVDQPDRDARLSEDFSATSQPSEEELIAIPTTPNKSSADRQAAPNEATASPEPTAQATDAFPPVPPTHAQQPLGEAAFSNVTAGDGKLDVTPTRSSRLTSIVDAAPANQTDVNQAPATPVTTAQAPPVQTEAPIAPPPVKVDTDFVVRQISTAVAEAAQSGRTLRIRLQPPELGVLQIEVYQRDGQVIAKLETQHSSTRQLLLDHLPALQEQLQQLGNRVERIDVSHNPTLNSEQQQFGDPRQFGEAPSREDQQERHPGFRLHNTEEDESTASRAHLEVHNSDQIDIAI